MVRRDTFPKVLLFLAALVFFSANSVYLLEADQARDFIPLDTGYHLNYDSAADKGPYLNLKSCILVNYDNGDVIYAKNADAQRPIASISKLITAMVLLDSGIDLDSTVEKITRKDAYRSSRSRLNVGFEMTLRDLLHACLMNSDNRAARAIARAVSGSIDDFAVEMNKKVRSLGLEHSHFVEPSGLSKKNVSTAADVAMILHYAYDYPLIAEITSKRTYRVKILNRRNTYRGMANTNLLMYSPYHVLAGKTGYIRAADYCLTTLLENKAGERLTLVVLGVPGNKLRFREARRLVDWGFKKIPTT